MFALLYAYATSQKYVDLWQLLRSNVSEQVFRLGFLLFLVPLIPSDGAFGPMQVRPLPPALRKTLQTAGLTILVSLLRPLPSVLFHTSKRATWLSGEKQQRSN